MVSDRFRNWHLYAPLGAVGRPRQRPLNLSAWLVRGFLPLPRTAGAKTNLPMCLRRCESSSLGRFAERVRSWLNLAAAEVPCRTAPFASFSGRTEKEGPARPERGPISSSVVKAIKNDKHNAVILRNCFDETISCDAGFADATSFSLLDAKRTKQEKHARGIVPRDPRARHFGSGQLRNTIKPVRRKGFKLTASRRLRHEAFPFPRCARKFPHEPRPQFGTMLPWPSENFSRCNLFK